MKEQGERETLSTLERGFDIIDFLMKNNGGRITEIAEKLDIAPSTAYKYLSTLTETGYAVKEGDTYHVGMRFLTVGGYAKHRKEAYKVSIKMVRRLAEETGERIQFLVEEHGRGIYLHTAVNEAREYGKVRLNHQLGKRRYLHSSAAGKAIMAHLPKERVDDIIERWGLPPATLNTITDQAKLKTELEQIRSTGIAFNDEESIEGLRAVGVAVMGPRDEVIGGLSVSGPVHRLKGDRYEEEFPDLLLSSANEIELVISHS